MRNRQTAHLITDVELDQLVRDLLRMVPDPELLSAASHSSRIPSAAPRSQLRVANAAHPASGFRAVPAPEEADLPPELHIKRQCELVWVSDFLQPLDAIESALKGLAYSGAHGYLVQIIDPAEEDFPFTGRARFEARSIRDTTILGRAETVKTNYRRRYDAHSEAVGQFARRLGWSFLRHRTDHSPATALIALYGAIGGARAQRGF